MSEMKAAKAVPLPTLGAENDLGKPWRYEDGDYTVTRSSVWSPPGCHPVGCGLKLYTDKDGKLVKVEGDENNPVTQGRLCVRCISLLDYVYNPARIIHPMKRDPKYRGQHDKWEQCSWDEAIDVIEENYRKITTKYGRESIIVFAGTGREGGTLYPYGSLMLGAPNYCYTQSGYSCYTPRLAGSAYTIGVTYPEIDYAGGLPDRYDDPNYTVPEVLMLWGKAPLESNPDGFFGHAVTDLMKRGTRLIVVDPRVNWLASRADYHLRLRAGTDTALGMSMLDVIISEDLYDHDFVDKWCYGFEQLAERVHTMPASKAAEICGIPAAKIEEAARMYANGRPSALQWGLAIDQKSNGMQAGQTIIDLMAVTGNIDVPGGQILADVNFGLNEAGFGSEKGIGKELMDKMIGLEQYPVYCNTILNAQCDVMLETLETGKPYPIKFGFYAGNNLMSCTSADPKRWHDALVNTLDFCFTVDTFMTPSAESTCDVFLPLSCACEEDGVLFTHYSGTPVYTGFMNQAMTTGEALSDIEICMKVGKRLNLQNFEEYEDYHDLIDHLRLGRQNRFADVHDKVVVQRDVAYYKYETGDLRTDHKPGFNTPTGRVELYSNVYAQFGEDPLPYYEEPQFSPINTPEKLEEYPFVLTTGARVFAFFHSENRQIPFTRELNPDPIVEVNPEVARKLSIADGQWCRVWNQFGSAVFKAMVTEIVDEKTIHCQHGWWFPEDDPNEPNLYGTFRSNVNNLVPNGFIGKLGFGAPFKCLLCNIEPIEKSYDTDMAQVWNEFKREDQ